MLNEVAVWCFKQVGPHGSNLAYQDRFAVCLARALLADPDVLIVHSPEQQLNLQQQHDVYFLLQQWVETRGMNIHR